MNYVFILDSVFLQVGSPSEPTWQTCIFYSYIVLLIYVNETIYLLENLPFFKILVNPFMAQDDSPYANVISKCMLWVRGLVPLSEFWDIQFSCSVVSDCLRPHGLQHTRLPCPLPTPRAYSNSYPLSQWSHPTISSSVIPFSSCLQSFPASGSFPMSQLLASGGQSIGISASVSVLPMNIQDWFPSGLTG